MLRSGAAPCPRTPRARKFNRNRQNRNQNNGNRYEREVLPDERNIAEQKAAEYKDGNPSNTTDDIVGDEL